jgi:hypothetical protein
MSSRTPGSRPTAADESPEQEPPDSPENHQHTGSQQEGRPSTPADGRGGTATPASGARRPTAAPSPGVFRLRYGDVVDRSLPVALDEVLVDAGLDDARRDVGFAVNVESIERLAHDTWFAVSVEFAGGELRITDDAVLFDRR